MSLDLVFNDSKTDAFLETITKQAVQGLMSEGNSVEYNGVSYATAIEYVFDRQMPSANGTLFGNFTARKNNYITCFVMKQRLLVLVLIVKCLFYT